MVESPPTSGRSTPRSFNGPRSAASPFDVDIGGGQREELRRQLESTRAELALLQEMGHLKDTQLKVLVKVQKQGAATGRIERWVLSTLSPVFHAWARLGAMEQARRGPRREAVKQKESARNQAALAHEKEQQVAALCDRVARIKHNAQCKLAELSEANKKLAAALEEKDKVLLEQEAAAKHLQRASHAQGGREVELQLELQQARDELQRSRGEAEARQGAASGADRARVAAAAELREVRHELAASRTEAEDALAAAVAQAREARGKLAEARAHAARQDAHAEGLETEVGLP